MRDPKTERDDILKARMVNNDGKSAITAARSVNQFCFGKYENRHVNHKSCLLLVGLDIVKLRQLIKKSGIFMFI